jgi:preprotein translocase subunit YajC
MGCVPAATCRRFFRAPGLSVRRRGRAQEEVPVLGSLTSLAAASSSSSGSSLSFIPILILFAGVFYFLLIRPQQRRARQQRSLIESVDVGDEVMTIGGIFGTVRAVEDDAFTVEVAPGVDLRVSKSAIARKLFYEDVDEDDEDEDEDQDEQAGNQAGDQA